MNRNAPTKPPETIQKMIIHQVGIGFCSRMKSTHAVLSRLIGDVCLGWSQPPVTPAFYLTTLYVYFLLWLELKMISAVYSPNMMWYS